MPRRLRVRTGCHTCRARKKKCDERKPACSGCARNSLNCRWPARPSHAVLQSPVETRDSLGRGLTVSFWSSLTEREFNLMGSYLSRTAICLYSRFTATNPFITRLMPLAMSDTLILSSLLAQSSAHQAITLDEPIAAAAAQDAHSDSLVAFRQRLNSPSSSGLSSSLDNHRENESSVDALIPVGIVAMIICFTEAVKGDRCGAILGHLRLAQEVLPPMLSRLHRLSPCLHDFMVEYYTYVACLSLISMDLSSQGDGHVGLEQPDLVARARSLANSGYIGSLCGCWMDLLLLIPEIAALRGSFVASGDKAARFAMLEGALSNWAPPSNIVVGLEISTVGMIYREAILLLLFTTDSSTYFHAATGGRGQHLASLAAASVARIIWWLRILPLDAACHTTLCWPIVIAASCAITDENIVFLRQRLENMSVTLHLGNIDRSIHILELLWCRQNRGSGP